MAHAMPEEPVSFNAEPSFDQMAGEYLELKREIDRLKSRQDAIKPTMMAALEQVVPDEDGHCFIELREEVVGYRGFQRQRRVSIGVDEDSATEILTERGLLERCMPPKPSLDEDEVMAAVFEGLLSEDDLDVIFPKKVTYALVPKK